MKLKSAKTRNCFRCGQPVLECTLEYDDGKSGLTAILDGSNIEIANGSVTFRNHLIDCEGEPLSVLTADTDTGLKDKS